MAKYTSKGAIPKHNRYAWLYWRNQNWCPNRQQPFRRQFVNKKNRGEWKNKSRRWGGNYNTVRWTACDESILLKERSKVKVALKQWMKDPDPYAELIFRDEIRQWTGWWW